MDEKENSEYEDHNIDESFMKYVRLPDSGSHIYVSFFSTYIKDEIHLI